MMQASTLMRITEAFPKCSFGVSAGEVVICDSSNEFVGKLNFRHPGVTIYKDYKHSKRATLRLKRAGIYVEIIETTMAEAMHILYD